MFIAAFFIISKMEIGEVAVDGGKMNKLMDSYSRKLLSNKKELTTDACTIMDDNVNQYVK